MLMMISNVVTWPRAPLAHVLGFSSQPARTRRLRTSSQAFATTTITLATATSAPARFVIISACFCFDLYVRRVRLLPFFRPAGNRQGRRWSHLSGGQHLTISSPRALVCIRSPSDSSLRPFRRFVFFSRRDFLLDLQVDVASTCLAPSRSPPS